MPEPLTVAYALTMLGLRIAQIAIRSDGLATSSDWADLVGDIQDAGSSASLLRDRLTKKGSDDALGQVVTSVLQSRIGGLPREGTQEAQDLIVAAERISKLLSRLNTDPNALRIASTHPERFHQYALNHGGDELLAVTEASATWTAEAILAKSCAVYTDLVLRNPNFPPAALQGLLRKVESLPAVYDLLTNAESGLSSIHATALRGAEAAEAAVASVRGLNTEFLQLAHSVTAVPGTGRPQTTRAAYYRQLAAAAPDELIDRETELAWLTDFTQSDQHGQYMRIEAGYRAGKTGLASWYATHSATDVEVVAFLITARQAGQSDADAFLDATIDQLNSFMPSPRAEPAAPARKGHFHHVLEAAAGHLQELGRRLVLIVDGLDEDTTGATPAWGQSSIASLLPTTPHPNLKIIVFGRPNPGLPDDLEPDHPLLHCHIEPLAASAEARRRGEEADAELREIFRAGDLGIAIVGYIAAARGGLTSRDLVALTEEPPFKITNFLTSRQARCLETRPGGGPDQPSSGRSDTQTWQLAHDTIQAAAEANLGTQAVRGYRERIHAWIAAYADRGWPLDTPYYTVSAYPALLEELGDTDRLCQLAADIGRRHWLYTATGADHTAHMQILNAQRHLATHGYLNLDEYLAELLALTIHRHELQLRSRHIPTNLPGLWAQLGRIQHAQELALSIPEAGEQLDARTEIAEVIAGTDPDRAEQIVRTFAPDQRTSALVAIARVIARMDPGRAERLVRTLDTGQQPKAFTAIAPVVAAIDPDRAEHIARTISLPTWQDRALTGVARVVAPTDLHRAESIIQTITFARERATALTTIAQTIVETDPRRALAMARAAEEMARAGIHSSWQVTTLISAAAVIAVTDPIGAERIARTITGTPQSLALKAIARAVAAIDPDRAEEIARAIPGPARRAGALKQIARVIAATDPGRAEKIARTIKGSAEQAEALAAIAPIIASTDFDRAEKIVRAISHPGRQATAVISIAQVIAPTDLDLAVKIIRTIRYTDRKASAFTAVAQAIVETDPDQCVKLARKAEQVARTEADPHMQAEGLTAVAKVIAASDLNRAQQLVDTITHSLRREKSLARVAHVVARTDTDRAVQLAHTIPTISQREKALNQITRVVAATDPDRAEKIAHTITTPHLRAWALVAVAEALAPNDIAQAERIAHTVSTYPAQHARVVTAIAKEVARTDLDRAVRTVFATHHLDQMWALGEIAGVIASTDPYRAVQLAHTVTQTSQRATVLAAIAPIVASSDPDRAVQLARTITSPSQGWRTLTQIARVISSTDPNRAIQLAHTINNNDIQVQAFAAILGSVSEGWRAASPCDRERLEKIVSMLAPQVLMSDHWMTVMAPIARISPSAVQAAAVLLLRLEGQMTSQLLPIE